MFPEKRNWWGSLPWVQASRISWARAVDWIKGRERKASWATTLISASWLTIHNQLPHMFLLPCLLSQNELRPLTMSQKGERKAASFNLLLVRYLVKETGKKRNLHTAGFRWATSLPPFPLLVQLFGHYSPGHHLGFQGGKLRLMFEFSLPLFSFTTTLHSKFKGIKI